MNDPTKPGANGQANGNAKLTDEKVYAIKRSKGKIKQRELAEIYGVSRSLIGKIQCGMIWNHIKVNDEKNS